MINSLRVHFRMRWPEELASASRLGGAGCGAGFTSAPGAIFIAL
jgi:hypothetical protein